MCRCTLTSRLFQGGDSVTDIQSEARAVFRKVIHFGQLYLETNPADGTFGGMWLWAAKHRAKYNARLVKQSGCFKTTQLD